jgi:magnesium chelatase family protein
MHTVRTGALSADVGEATQVVRARVVQARATAAERWRPYGVRTNAEVSGPLLRQRFRHHHDAMGPLRQALDKGLLSIRGVDRTMRVADVCRDQAGVSEQNLLSGVTVTVTYGLDTVRPTNGVKPGRLTRGWRTLV